MTLCLSVWLLKTKKNDIDILTENIIMEIMKYTGKTLKGHITVLGVEVKMLWNY